MKDCSAEIIMVLGKVAIYGLIHSSPNTIPLRLPFARIMSRRLDPFCPITCLTSEHPESARLLETPLIQASIISWARPWDSRQCTFSLSVHLSSNSILLQRTNHPALPLICPPVISLTPSLQVHNFHG